MTEKKRRDPRREETRKTRRAVFLNVGFMMDNLAEAADIIGNKTVSKAYRDLARVARRMARGSK